MEIPTTTASIAAAAVDSNPAGGAAIWEALAATAVGLALTLALLVLGWAHRSGRTRLLAAPAERAERLSGLPGWAALPTLLVAGSLLVAVFGMYWDISIHIADGRDAGPFANPAHFFILAGLFGVFVAGFLGVVLPEGRPSRAAVRLGEDWYAPLGAIGLLAAAGFALTGFPLDDFWHRLFGQDVTLWGPTHLMMIGGAALAFVGHATLLGEARPHERDPERGGRGARIAAASRRFRYALLAGGFLIGLSTFQAEFDFGVPQFRMLFEPLLIAFAAGVALVAARIYGGRGGALAAAGMFLLIRGGLALLVGPVLGEPTPYFPLYLGAALLVEATALGIDPRRRPYAFALAAGLLIGTAGTAIELGWSRLVMPIPWSDALLGEVALLAPAVAVASALLGAWIANCWRTPLAPAMTPRLAAWPAALGLAAIVLAVGYGLQTQPDRGVSAEVSLREITPAPERTVAATVRIDPPGAARDADWLTATAWQGQGLHLDHMRETSPGLWRTTEPLPVHGSWKALIRLHKGDSIAGLPVYLPEDTAIPAEEVAAPARFSRDFVADSEILQREQLDDVPGWVKVAGYGLVGSIVVAIIALLGWSLGRLDGRHRPPETRAGGSRRRTGRWIPGRRAPGSAT